MFSLQFPKIFASRLVRPFAMLVIAALAAPGAALATPSQWASVGSTGVTDESCFYFAVQMDTFEARSTPGQLFPCKLRYQVTDTFGGLSTVNLALRAHIRDTTITPGQVLVNLYEYPKAGSLPSGRLLATINTNVTAAGPTLANGFTPYNSHSGATCGAAPTLDFVNNSYWIEVDLMPAPFTPLPGLAIASLQLRTCI